MVENVGETDSSIATSLGAIVTKKTSFPTPTVNLRNLTPNDPNWVLSCDQMKFYFDG